MVPVYALTLKLMVWLNYWDICKSHEILNNEVKDEDLKNSSVIYGDIAVVYD